MMKVRAGFVSNSSSANFIVTWTCGADAGESIESVVRRLFDDEDHMKPERDEIVKNTKMIAFDDNQGIFETNFFTCMLNSPCSLGDAAAQLLLALEIQKHQGEMGVAKLKTVLDAD
jgi:hypothetical protein